MTDDSLYNGDCPNCALYKKYHNMHEVDVEYETQEEKFPDELYEIEWGWMAYCTECKQPAKNHSSVTSKLTWSCINPTCKNDNIAVDLHHVGFNIKCITKDELEELQKTYHCAEWS